ncbi:RNA-binding protein 4.1-like isoform X2 [Cylas formicarius]|uniref:RNA-binding protein 4.1-like isoform X2 n=1 Tax=Cylas formicarius TaxID=197179 RepID=UPI0029585466|nr:RNA-binding protein 4.1-like isoform X2 [Cylas formicarius]
MTRGRSETTTKVFVGSLPAGVTPEDLRKLFAPYGAIAECDISNRCGFLHLEDAELAMKAITELNGTEFMGGRISVEKGRVKPRRGSNGGGVGPARGGRDRGGPYSRGGREFRGPPRGAPGAYGVAREYPQYDRFGGGEDRYGGPPPPRTGYERAYGAPPAARSVGGYPPERGYGESADMGYGAAAGYGTGYDDGYDARRAIPYDDRRAAGPPAPPRPPAMDAGANRGAADLFSRRDAGPKPPMAAGYDTTRYGAGANGYGTATATAAANYGPSAGYSTAAPPAQAAYGAGYAAAAPPTGPVGYATRDDYGAAAADPSYAANAAYATGGGVRGAYDSAYPPLPQQRGLN